MKQLALIALLFAVTGCGPSGPNTSDETHIRQQPSNYTPGVHVSGHLNVGVVRNF